MQRSGTKLLTAVAIGVSFASPGDGHARQTLTRHWRETASETLWTVRYNNCDYGYYVSLPAGVVAHGNLPPSPNHGFLIALPDVGTRNDVLGRKGRSLWADASYDTSGTHSLSDVVAEQDSGPTRRSQTQVKMAGLSAIRVESEHGAGASKVVEVMTVALRDDIVYTVGMRTSGGYVMADESEYNRIVQGFKLLPLPGDSAATGSGSAISSKVAFSATS